MGMVMANADGTLKRTNVVTADSQAVTINGGGKSIILNSNTVAKGSFDTEGSMRFSGTASNGKFAGARDQSSGEKRLLTVDGEGNVGTSQFSESEIIDTIDQVEINTNQIKGNNIQINKNTSNINDNRSDIDRNKADIRNNTTRINKNSKKINKLQDAASALGDAAEAAGAMGAALSGIPEMSLLPDEPVRCGIAGGGYGSQYAIAGGCAARIKDSIHVNTAIAYSPSVDYVYGSTSSFAGRVGISFPLGAKPKTSEKEVRPSRQNWIDPSANPQTSTESMAPSQALWYRTEVKDPIAKLQSDVISRDEQIDSLKSKLELLIEQQQQLEPRPQAAESTDELIALLQQRIDELEEEKRQSAREDDKQNAQINNLKQKLAKQETRFEAMMKELQSLLPEKGKV